MIEIPLTVPVPPRSTFSMELAGVAVAFELRWNSATSGWYLDSRTPDGDDVLLGRRLTIGRPIGWRSLDPRFPLNGWLVLIDTTGAQEDPGFTDMGTRHRLLFIDRTDVPRLPVTVQRLVNPRAFVPTDGPDLVYIPQIAAHWAALGIPTPTRQWSTQVTSGDLTTLIGTGDLAAGGSGHLYEQTETGWNYTLVSGNTGTWDLSHSLASGERYAALLYSNTIDASASIWYTCGAGVNGGGRAEATATGAGGVQLRELKGSTTTAGAQDHAGQVRPFYLVAQRDLSTQLFDLYTDLEQVSESSSGGVGGGVTDDFSIRANTITHGPIITYWDGNGVDALEAAGLLDEALLSTLGWTIPY